jgi:hypothetical protein
MRYLSFLKFQLYRVVLYLYVSLQMRYCTVKLNLIFVTCTPIARQHVGKKCSRENKFLVNSPLLGYATVEEAVFYVTAVTSLSGGWWSRDMCLL